MRVLRPWPAVGAIRWVFGRGARTTLAELQRHLPADIDSVLTARLDVPYRLDEPGTAGGTGAVTRVPYPTLNVFRPVAAAEPLPAIVWIHGGAWISGAKEDVDPYVKLLAARGFAGVSVDYSISPEVRYPAALVELNDALGFLTANAHTLGVDARRIVLAGDSAGANLASQLAAMITDSGFAAEVGIEPAIDAAQLRGVVLHCGIFDVADIDRTPGIGGWGFRRALRAYLGRREWSHTAGATQMSTLHQVSAPFVPTFISGGDGDPLTEGQSRPLAARLADPGVPVTELFYTARTPPLPHEYQFHLDGADARAALEETVDFVRSVT